MHAFGAAEVLETDPKGAAENPGVPLGGSDLGAHKIGYHNLNHCLCNYNPSSCGFLADDSSSISYFDWGALPADLTLD